MTAIKSLLTAHRYMTVSLLGLAILLSGFFVSNALALVTSINLTSPNGGEIWSGTHNITWTAVGDPGDTVTILLSNDDFFTSATLVASIAYDAGSFAWNTTAVADGTNYKIRIQSPLGVFDSSVAAFEVDNTAPVIASVTLSPNSGTANIGDVVTATIDADENVYTAGAITINGVATTGFTNNGDTTYTVTYTVASGNTDRTAGTVPVSVVLLDNADVPNSNTAFTTVVANTLAIDANVPTLSPVHIQSNHTNNQYAKVGHVVTLSFTANEAINTPTVTIAGNPADSVIGGPTSWSATYTTTGSETEGIMPFTINFSDIATNTGVQVTATSDSSSVTFDMTNPAAPSLTLLDPVNSVNQTAITITGTGEANATVNYSIDDTDGGTSAVVGTGTVSGLGAINITGINVSSLTDGTLTVTATLTDLAGNTGVAGNDTALKETVLPTVMSITTKDTNADGKVETATIVFSEAVDDSTFAASNFTIGGVTGTSIDIGTADDDTFNVIIAGGVNGTLAKDVTYTPGSGVDLNGNPLSAVSTGTITEIDGAGPVMLSATTTSVTTLTTTWSEDLDGSTVNGSGSEFTVAGTTVTAASETTAGVVTLTYAPALGTGAEPLVTFTNLDAFRDLAIVPNEAPTPQAVTAVDGVAPLLSPVSIISNNASTTLAMEGNTITLSFTASEEITAPTVTIQGVVAGSITNPSGDNWVASRLMLVGDTQGPVSFSIVFADNAVPTPNAGVTVTATTDSSSVFFDSVNPNVNAGTDKEVNALVNQDATVSDDVPSSGIATYAWTKQSGPGAITFGSASAEDTTISADTDGTYTIRLTVTDNAGNVTFDEMTFIWDTTNPEPLTAIPSDGAIGVALAAGTATVTYDEDIVLLDGSRVLLVNDATSASHKGTVAVQGGNGASAVLEIDYTGLAFGTKYRINVKPNALEDVAGNNLASNFISYFTTTIDTVVPVVNSFSAGTITETGATLSVTTDESATCSYATTDSAYGSMTAFDTPNTGTSHTAVITGLTASTGYDYFVRCADTTAQTNTMTTSAHVSFTTLTPDTSAPVITNIQVGSFTQTGVTITWNTDENATSRVEYGTSSSYGTLSAVDGTADNTSHSVALSGLSAGTVYHFRVLSTDALSNAGMSSDAIFTTSPADPDTATPPDPTITTSIATVNSDSYTISGIAGADVPSASIRTISVYNGLALAGTTIVPIGQTGWALVVSLNQNTTNSFTAVSTDAAGNSSAASVAVVITEDETVGADLTAPDAPVFTTVDITVDADTYELTGTTTADSDIQTVFIECGCSVVGSVNVPAGETAWALTVSLDQNTANVFTARSADASGNISGSSASVTITEATTVTPDTSAPLSSNIQATSIITTGATITWDTDEGATSLVEYGLTSEYGSMTSVDPTLVTSHSVALSGLLANTTYHYRVVSDDTLGNSASSTDNTFTTAIDDTATLAVTGIDAVDTFAVDDDTYANGWSWTFHVTVPTSETEFALKFSDFISGANTIFAGSNIRYYTAQSTEADTIGEAVTITGANTYPATISLDSDADAVAPGRQINVVVEMKVPAGSAGGSYSAQYGVTSN